MAVTMATLVVLAVPVLFIRSCVSTLGADEPILASSHGDERIMSIGSHIMRLEHGSVGSRIADWLQFETTDTGAFEIGDDSFAPNSVRLTAHGLSQLAHFSQFMTLHRALSAHIMVAPGDANSKVRELEEMRAQRLRAEIIADGVPASKVTALEDPPENFSAPSEHVPTDGDSKLVVLLSR